MSWDDWRWRFRLALAGLVVAGFRLSGAPLALAANAQGLEPIVFNATTHARPGDLIGIQGANFDDRTRVEWQRRTGSSEELPIVNRFGSSWLAVQLPAASSDPFLLRIRNDRGPGPLLRVNAARPLFIDATRIVPGGRFRILGRGLMAPDVRPLVSVEGHAAEVDLAASSEHMLVVTAPLGLAGGDRAEILCDNGNGTGTSRLESHVVIATGPVEDRLRLGVGWAAGFDFTQKVRPSGAVCDGLTDDAAAIGKALAEAAAAGGGVVELPAGICRLGATIDMATRTILRGAGRDRTTLRYEHNVPIFAEKFDLIGLERLTLQNKGSVEEGLIWRQNTRSFIRDVGLNMGKSRQWFLTSNRDFVVDNNEITQTDSYNLQNPYRFDGSAGLVFSNNRSINVNGSPTFQAVRDALFINNHFTRDARSQDEAEVVAHHGFVMDFAARVAVLDNTFDVANGPVTNTTRNDGETLISEGGGPFRTENVGTVKSATRDEVDDPDNRIDADPFRTGLPEGFGIVIVTGKAAGQSRQIVGYDGRTIKVDRAWDLIPEPGSRYSTFVWGLEKAIIKGNRLVGNPRGIWLYQTSIRDVSIEQNRIEEGGGIFLRSYQNLDKKVYTFQANVAVNDNQIRNSSGRWMSHIIVASVSADPPISGTGSLGIGQLGIEIRRNYLLAGTPNTKSLSEDYASQEGFMNVVRLETAAGRPRGTSSILGTIFQDNVCDKCERAYVVGTASLGTTLQGNVPRPTDPGGLVDQELLPGTRAGASSRTLAR